jgi:hypothetical protein
MGVLNSGEKILELFPYSDQRRSLLFGHRSTHGEAESNINVVRKGGLEALEKRWRAFWFDFQRDQHKAPKRILEILIGAGAALRRFELLECPLLLRREVQGAACDIGRPRELWVAVRKASRDVAGEGCSR